MFGSSRRKLTKLIHNIDSFHHLNQLCNNQHEHELQGQKPDGSWATAKETAYRWPLARAMATQVVLQLSTMSLAKLCRRRMHTPSSASIDQRPASQPPPVPEFTQLIHQSDSSPLPPHARKLSTPKRGYVASAPENHITVGIHVSLQGLVQEALRLQHPTEQQPLFPKEVRANVSRLTSKTVHQVAKERTEQGRKWTILVAELSEEERKLKGALSPRIAEVLKDKRLCLFDMLIREAGHEDQTFGR